MKCRSASETPSDRLAIHHSTTKWYNAVSCCQRGLEVGRTRGPCYLLARLVCAVTQRILVEQQPRRARTLPSRRQTRDLEWYRMAIAVLSADCTYISSASPVPYQLVQFLGTTSFHNVRRIASSSFWRLHERLTPDCPRQPFRFADASIPLESLRRSSNGTELLTA